MNYIYINNERAYIRDDLISYVDIIANEDLNNFRVVLHTYSTDKVEFTYGTYGTYDEANKGLEDCMAILTND